MVFQGSLNDSKSSQVSRTHLSILAGLNNVVVWMVSTRHLISMSSSPCSNLSVTVPSALITIGIAIIFIFHSFQFAIIIIIIIIILIIMCEFFMPIFLFLLLCAIIIIVIIIFMPIILFLLLCASFSCQF